MFKISFIIIITLYLSACQSIDYTDDLGFISSAEASYENLPAFINGKPCLDMDNEIGRCSKAIQGDKQLEIKIPSRPYAYNFTINLTSGVGCVIAKIGGQEINLCPPIKIDVMENTEVEIIIPPTSFIDLFMIVGRIAPKDRPEPISALFRALITVYDSNYSKREGIVEYKGYLVPGEHALYTDVYFVDKVRKYKEKTAIKLKQDYLMAFSESYNMRFNFESK